MSEYLKVSDLIDGPVRVGFSDGKGDSVTYNAKIGNELCVNYHRLIEHAINSHDELVAQRDELLDALEALLRSSVMSVSHSEYIAVFDEANSVLTKAKGGAA